jgi:hypothetical protein
VPEQRRSFTAMDPKFFRKLFEVWEIPLGEEDDAPVVTSLHDGLDWIELHAPRSFFEHLRNCLVRGDYGEVEKWLAVWSTQLMESDPSLCGARTRKGGPCHYSKPCKHHHTDEDTG